jgi:hypothetical protein
MGGMSYWLLGEENEEADSSKGSASVSLAVSRILRGTSSERFTAKAGEELLVIGDWLLGEEKKKSSVNGHWSLGNRIKMPLLIWFLLSLGLLSPSETECLKLETLFPFRKRGAGRPLSLKHGRAARAPLWKNRRLMRADLWGQRSLPKKRWLPCLP